MSLAATFHELIDCKESQLSVEPNSEVKDVLASMKIVPDVFRTLTNFAIIEFEELCTVVCPVIVLHARSTGDVIVQGRGRPPKLSPQQRLLAFVLYLKHDNTTMFEAHQWNWAKSSVCDDAVFIASCIDYAAKHELRWPNTSERIQLGKMLPEFPGCIGFIDGTLCKIKRQQAILQRQEIHLLFK